MKKNISQIMLCRKFTDNFDVINYGLHPTFMFYKTSFLLIFSLLCLILIITNFIVSIKSIQQRNSITRFECGFDTFKNARTPFSLHFFLLRIIFLVFDLEIILLFPFPLRINFSLSSTIPLFSFFILILILGLSHEWNEGSLEWY